MNNYVELIKDIIKNGTWDETRTGEKAISVFGRTLRFRMKDGFPLMTIKHVSFKQVMTELLWFLKGRKDLRYLLQHNNKIWVGDAYKKYKRLLLRTELALNEAQFIEKILSDDKFSAECGDLGRIYGPLMTAWPDTNYGEINQLHKVLGELRTNPTSRRLIVQLYNPATVHQGILPPCHTDFQFYSIPGEDGIRKLSLKFNMRSNDVPLGAPYNIASYAAILHIFAAMTNHEPDELFMTIVNAHIYENQLDYAHGIIRRSEGDCPPLPRLTLNLEGIENPEDLELENFKLEGYVPLGKLPAPLSN